MTSYIGRQVDPQLSPDGNQVVFSWNGEKNDNYDIYVKLIGPGEPLRLTTNPAPDHGPHWSPDGRTIAFTREVSPGVDLILTVPPLGGPERKIAEIRGDARSIAGSLGHLCWTPDGKSLIVAGSQDPNANPRRMLVSVETGEMKALTNPPPQFGDDAAAISPDGRTLAFTRSAGADLERLYFLGLTNRMEPSGEPARIETGDRPIHEPSWSPDGREVFYAYDAGTNETLYRLRLAGGGVPSPLPFAGPATFGAMIARQAHRMVYVRGFDDTNIWRIDLTSKNTPQEKLIASSFREVFPQYSPDGKQIVFHSDRSGIVQIWISNADGSQAVQLTDLPGPTTGTPRWSPDGQQISFDSNTGGQYQIYVTSKDGGKPRQLTNESSTNVISNWSHDAKWIYFGSTRTGRFEVWKVPSQGGPAVQVTHNGGEAAVESPDGRTLFFNKENGLGGIWKMPVEGGPEVQVLKEPVYRYNFAVTEDGIYFTPPRNKDGSSSVQFLNFATGKISQIGKINNTVDLGLAVSPDRRSLLFAQIDYRGSNLMLSENFR